MKRWRTTLLLSVLLSLPCVAGLTFVAHRKTQRAPTPAQTITPFPIQQIQQNKHESEAVTFLAPTWRFRIDRFWGGTRISAEDYGQPANSVIEVNNLRLPDWSSLRTLPATPAKTDYVITERVIGYPFGWLSHKIIEDATGSRFNRRLVRPGANPRLIKPTLIEEFWRVRWLDALAELAALTLPWLTLLFLVGVIRVLHRRRHQRCLECGYDLRGAASDRCTECGSPLKDIQGVLPRDVLRFAAIALPALAIILIPIARDRHRLSIKKQQWEASAWLDDYLGGETALFPNPGLDWIERIRSLPAHPDAIQDRLASETNPITREILAQLVVDLVNEHTDDAYLPILGSLVDEGSHVGLRGWPIACYGAYRFPKVADRLLAILNDDECTQHTALRVLIALEESWKRQPVPQYATELRTAVLPLLERHDDPQVKLYALHFLTVNRMWRTDDAQSHLDELVHAHPYLERTRMVEEIHVAIGLGAKPSNSS